MGYVVEQVRNHGWSILDRCFDRTCLHPVPEMHDAELAVLDVVVQLVRPTLIVEVGTWDGGSALFFARWADQVITMDHAPRVHDLRERSQGRIQQVRGMSPQDLEKTLWPVVERELIGRGQRWLFFHDGEHYGDCLVAEVRWAFKHNAVCAAWHDVGQQLEQHVQRGDMLSGMCRLIENGVEAFRLNKLPGREVCDQFTPAPWTGIGFAWNPHWRARP